RVRATPALSIAHAQDMAVALVGPAQGDLGIGIDLQPLASLAEPFDLSAFAPRELELLQQATGPEREQRRLRFWCAKEAAAKAVGRGLVDGPRSVEIVWWDAATGQASVELGEALAGTFPHLAGRQLRVYTQRQDTDVVAACFGEQC